MPIYEYRCVDCQHEFEVMQKFSDPPLEQCPSCPGTVHKLISRSAFHLKGSGWYVTDYARKSSQNGSSSTGGANAASSSSESETSSSTTSASTSASSGTETSAKETSKPSPSASTAAA